MYPSIPKLGKISQAPAGYKKKSINGLM